MGPVAITKAYWRKLRKSSNSRSTLGLTWNRFFGSDPKKRFHVNPRVDLEFEDFRSFRQYAFVIATGPICTTLVGLGTMYWAPVSLKSLVWQADYYVSFPGQDLPSFTTLLILLIAYLGIADIINILPWRLGSKVWPDGYRLKLGWRASRKAGPFKAPSMAAAAQEQQNHDSNNEAQA